MKTIILNESQFNSLFENSIGVVINSITQYIKGFSRSKGKLPSNDIPLKEYYKPYLNQAYGLVCDKLDDVKRNGFAYFEMLFRNYVVGNFKMNKRGLIYVERSIDFNIDKGLRELEFKSIGECWSWGKNNSRSYCSSFGLNDKTLQVVICGYVHPSSVDWLETIYLNSYDMKNETEIRMNDNAEVEVSYYRIGTEKYRLGGSYLINSSADKYRKNNK